MPDLITLPQQFFSVYEQQPLPQLMAEFRELDIVLDNQEYETRKLIILKIIEQRLRTKLNRPIVPMVEQSAIVSDHKQAIVQFVYKFCLVFGCFEKAAGSFLFGSNLFALIPGISHFSLYTLTIIYTLLDALLFYAFEVSFLKKALGVVFPEHGACILNATFSDQLQTTIEINLMLNRRESIDWEIENAKEYEVYCDAAKLFNHHLLKKHATMKEYTTSTWKRCIENGVVLFGAISSVADSYFVAKTALLTLHISFMSSPIGCALVVAIVVSALVFYYAMGARSMSKLINPDRKSYNALRDGLGLFRSEYEYSAPYRSKYLKHTNAGSSLTTDSSTLTVENDGIYQAAY